MSTIPGGAPMETTPNCPSQARQRLAIVDRLRGLVIILMALDHVREYFNREALLFVAEDLSRTTPLIFATRWVTHLCAPTFVLLSGVSVALQQDAGKTGATLSRFLLTRGAWLVLLELTVVSQMFNFGWPFLFLQVIWAIGASMILLAGAIWLPRRVVLTIGIAIVAGGQAVAYLGDTEALRQSWLWTVAMRPGVLPFAPSFVAYPVIPWFGIMALGYGAGDLALLRPTVRDRRLVQVGLGMLAAFAALRIINGYGNPAPWTGQPNGIRALMSFVNVNKYPPSLDYVLVTLGTTITLAPFLGRMGGPLARMMDAFGRTPLLTYLLHVLLIHVSAMALGIALGHPAALFTNFIADSKRLADAGWGLSIGATFAVWLAVMLALWPAAAWFAQVKARRRDWWLSYL